MSHTSQQIAAATLAEILERQSLRGETRLWLDANGRTALDELDKSSKPADPRMTLRELAIGVKAAGPPEGYGKRMVFASGDPGAELMLVGNAPSEDDALAGSPFAGEVGVKLDGILKAMGLQRDDLYLTNIAKFRPLESSEISGEHIASFRRVVLSEIHAVKPRVIVALGETAVQALSDDAASMDTHRGKQFEIDGVPVIATDHPNELISIESQSADVARRGKRAFWEDMLRVMELLELNISAKQRGFFT